MSFNSISSSSMPAARFLAKNKRGSRWAKLKQEKLDVRRHQWLSQVKNKGCEEEPSRGEEMHDPPMHQASKALEVNPTDGEKDGSRHNGNNSEPSWNSPSSHTGSGVESNGSGTNGSGSSRSCGSGTFYLGNISEVEEDGCLDDWEALADALAAADDKEDQRDQEFESLLEDKNVVQLDHLPEAVELPVSTVDVLKPKPAKCDESFESLGEDKNVVQFNHQPAVVYQPTATVDVLNLKPENGQAWRRGDAFRSKPKPENRQAWRHGDAFRSKPKPENGKAWRRGDAFRWKPKPEFGQAWRRSDAFRSKPKPDFSQAWRRDDAFRRKPKPEKHDKKCKSLVEGKNVTQLEHLPEVVKQPTAPMDYCKPKPELALSRDDVFRPKSLPNPQKKHSFPIKGNGHYRHGGTTSGCKNFVSAPTSCPICCEDLDSTDSSFLPCSCGFQLCLFCHKRILEEDSRCPGCRKHYDDNDVKWEENSDMVGDCATPRLARSCSMITRF